MKRLERLHHLQRETDPAPGGGLAALDARALLLTWTAFLLLLASVGKYELSRALAFAGFPLFVAVAASVPARLLIHRLALVSPFVLTLAAANPFFDHTPRGQVLGLLITGGMLSAAVVVVKALVALAAVITLERCVPFPSLVLALRRLGVPTVFTTQLLLLYRYSFLLANEAASMIKARDARSVSARGRGLRATAQLIGALLLRSTARAERIYKAMLARGFDGTLPAPLKEGFGFLEIGFILSAVGVFCVLRFAPLPG